MAAQEGHLDVTKYLISQGSLVNREDNEGGSALHTAAHQGHIDVTDYLITQGADVNRGDKDCQVAEVNRRDNDGRNALHLALQNGHLDVVQVLMAGGAHFDVEDIHGQTPLQLSLFLGYESIADLFMGRSNSKLDQDDGDTSTIEKLVSGGADLNIQSPDGQTSPREAITLCNNSEKLLQETDTLRKVSNTNETDTRPRRVETMNDITEK
eukprot:XP_011665285.1 PREDICTED: serine/threonine-protein phosphatase 6 regulatory ankyrin repeat subunit C-like [Strongylocentrotus purpuratus]